jgi:hypothetical protein
MSLHMLKLVPFGTHDNIQPYSLAVDFHALVPRIILLKLVV